MSSVCVSKGVRAGRRTGAIRRATGATGSLKSGPKKVLLVNTPAGGHAVIGYSLAKTLSSEGHAVTILVPCEEFSSKMLKPPFTRFQELRDMGVSVKWSEDGASGMKGEQFDVVLDNNGKDMDSVGPSLDFAKSAGSEQFVFISSAGMYTPGLEVSYVEGDPVKESAGHNKVEQALAGGDMAWSVFRPQYMTGSGQNKDCEEYFFDRIVRSRPVCVPGSGMQLTSVTPVDDLTDMIAAAVGNPAAYNQIFNCVGERTVTLDGMVRLCAAAVGVDPQIVHYDPKEADVDVKKAFPFRPIHFYSEPRAAVDILGWRATRDLEKVLKERYDEYVSSGRPGKDIQFE